MQAVAHAQKTLDISSFFADPGLELCGCRKNSGIKIEKERVKNEGMRIRLRKKAKYRKFGKGRKICFFNLFS